MSDEQFEPPLPRRALRDAKSAPLPRRAARDTFDAERSARRAWHRVPLDTPVERLGGADLIAVRNQDAVLASIELNIGSNGLVFATISSWRNGGEWPRHRERQVPGYTTVESLALAHGLMPTSAFYLPGLRWRGRFSPQVVEQTQTITLAATFAKLPRITAPRDAAMARVAEIRALYGRMLADIAYRIENSALFDSGVPTTRQFETALALCSDITPITSDEETIRRCATVTVAFETARAHAETVGLLHLPQTARGAARRAAGAARLARSSTSEAERDAAQARVVSILRSLALDRLPDPEALPRAITPPPSPTPRR